jgi:hypothetical protein
MEEEISFPEDITFLVEAPMGESLKLSVFNVDKLIRDDGYTTVVLYDSSAEELHVLGNSQPLEQSYKVSWPAVSLANFQECYPFPITDYELATKNRNVWAFEGIVGIHSISSKGNKLDKRKNNKG